MTTRISWRQEYPDGTVLLLRPAKGNDVACITSNWLNTFRNAASSWGVPNTEYFYYEHKVLEWILPRSTTVIMCPEEDPDQIVGFMVYEKLEGALLVHWVHIKVDFRGRGLARGMVEAVLDVEGHPPVIHDYRTLHSADINKMHRQRHKDYKKGLAEKPKYPDTSDWRYNYYLKFTTLPEGWERRDQ